MVIPKHVGFIMDGNGRWALERGLSRSDGHRAGLEHIREVLEVCYERGVQIVSVYAWSTENWDRPISEVRKVMGYIRTLGPKFAQDLHAQKVRIIHSGSREKLSRTLLRVIDRAVKLTQKNGPRTLNLVFNYGGRAEVVQAVKQLLVQNIPPEEITEKAIAHYLYTSGLPDVDLVIRAGGDRRISNFLLWQSAYADMYFVESYWPSLSLNDIENAITYYNRKRRAKGQKKVYHSWFQRSFPLMSRSW